MRIGYSYWGFLGDYKEDRKGNSLSTPDGNAAYGCYLIDALAKAGHRVFMMQEDRDWPIFQRRGKYNFEAFSQDLRLRAYLNPIRIGEMLPSLDVLLLEWRFPIPGRNTAEDRGKPGYQHDLDRQHLLIEHYSTTDTKIIIWDLDHKLTDIDEQVIRPDAILETSHSPRRLTMDRLRVEPPVAVKELRQFTPMAPMDRSKRLVYIGSRYERDDIIEEYIKPISERYSGEVHFYGNWTKPDNLDEVRQLWPGIEYHDRITMRDFKSAYGNAVAVPLLAKRGYLETGFITPRVWEALLFGTLPVGLAVHRGIEEYLPRDLIARDAREIIEITDWIKGLDEPARNRLRQAVVERISFMDASNFVRVIEGVVNGKGTDRAEESEIQRGDEAEAPPARDIRA